MKINVMRSVIGVKLCTPAISESWVKFLNLESGKSTHKVCLLKRFVYELKC